MEAPNTKGASEFFVFGELLHENLAGLAVGFFESPEDVIANKTIDRVFTPSMDASKRTALLSGWQHAVQSSRGWAKGE